MMNANGAKFKANQFFKQNYLPILSGLLIGTSYVPFPPWAVLFCWIPLWVDIFRNSASFKSAFYKAWITQFLLTLIGFHWVAYVAAEFGDIPLPLAIAAMLLFATAVHLYIPAAAGATIWLKNRFKLKPWAVMLLFATLTCAGEMYWPSLFPWHMGYTLLWIHSPLAQLADIVGFQGLSYFLLLCNAVLAIAVLGRNAKTLGLTIASLVAVLIALHFIGKAEQKSWSDFDAQLNVLQVQANIGNLEKVQAEKGIGFQQNILDDYFNLTQKGVTANPDTQLIIWPESAFPAYLDSTDLLGIYANQFVQFTKGAQRAFLTGAYSHQVTFGGNAALNKDFNAMFAFDQSGNIIEQPYRKTHLLAFGEYMPFEDDFPFLAKLNPNAGSFGRGKGPQVFHVPVAGRTVGIGSQICYESLYPEFSRELAQKGAEVLVNITNDSWFGPRGEPYQHMIMTLARAIEVRRPLLRTTNTGVTTAILADGTRLQESPIGVPWSDKFEIFYKQNPPQTFFSLYGQWLPLIGLLVFLIAIAFGRNRKTI